MASNCNGCEKRKRNNISISDKLELIKKLESGVSVASVCQQYGVKKQTVSDIRKSKEKLRAFAGKFNVDPVRNRKGVVRMRKHMKVSPSQDPWYVQQQQYIKSEERESEAALAPEAEAAAAPPGFPPISSGNTPPPVGHQEASPAPSSPSTSLSSERCRSTSSATPSKPRKRRAHPTPVQEAILKRLQTLERGTEKPHGEDSFCQMVGEMLQRLPERHRLDAKFEIHRLLYRKTLDCQADEDDKSTLTLHS
ncbi:uncharacterized protein LOC133467379 [Phyllopteryx taeniolatus]|uniref:uncharacterized protein LOC133467379 n=1 Tax=Phyllopteryx taeniolatus TaxID=161469 RepID=UPI002AD4A07F|nr:uncharacterized protein LOC133467379 [Phyllopteryx taeniolatus]